MPGNEPPITAELWRRLFVFDRDCGITLNRVTSGYNSEFKGKKVWLVTIRPDKPMGFEMAQAENLRVADALEKAMADARKRGWHDLGPKLRLSW